MILTYPQDNVSLFCQRYFSLLLPCTTCVASRCNRGRIGTAFGLTRNSALYFNCLLFSRFGDNIFIPLSTHLLAVANNQHDAISPSYRPSTTVIIDYIWLAWSSHLSTHLTVGVAPNFNSLAVHLTPFNHCCWYS